MMLIVTMMIIPIMMNDYADGRGRYPSPLPLSISILLPLPLPIALSPSLSLCPIPFCNLFFSYVTILLPRCQLLLRIPSFPRSLPISILFFRSTNTVSKRFFSILLPLIILFLFLFLPRLASLCVIQKLLLAGGISLSSLVSVSWKCALWTSAYVIMTVLGDEFLCDYLFVYFRHLVSTRSL